MIIARNDYVYKTWTHTIHSCIVFDVREITALSKPTNVHVKLCSNRGAIEKSTTYSTPSFVIREKNLEIFMTSNGYINFPS